MRAVLAKALADLRGRPGQSALIAVTVAAAATLLYLGLVTLTTVRAPYDRLMEKTRGAHALMLMAGPDRGEALARSLAARPEVAESALRPALMTMLKLPGHDRQAEVIAMEVEPGPQSMMGYVVVEGRDLAPGEADGAVLAVSVARYFGLAVGDDLEVMTAAGAVGLKLVGLHADPMWCAYPTCDLQNLYIAPGALGPGATAGQAMFGVRLSDPGTAGEILAAAQRDAGGTRLLTAWTANQVRRGVALMQGLSVLSVLLFAVVAIFASALITANIIGGAVLGQYREIAVLKVLGTTRMQVLAIFGGQSVALGLAGALVGVGAGHGVALRTLRPLAETMGNTDLLGFQPWAAGLTLLAILLISGLFAVLAAWRAVTLRPAAALQEGFSQPRAKVGLPVRLLTVLRAPAPVVLGVKDATARPGRAALTIISVALCLVTITMSTGIAGLVSRLKADPATLGVPYDMWVGAQALPLAEAEAAVAADEGVDFYCRQAFLHAAVAGGGESFTLRALDGDWQRFGFDVVQGRLPAAPGEVALAPGTMDDLGATVGQRLELLLGGYIADVTVVGEYRDPFNLGMMALTTLETLQAAWPGAPVEALLVKLGDPSQGAAVRDRILEATGHRATVGLTRTFLLPPTLTDMLGRMRTLSVLMAGIAVLSLLNSALLTAREQMREVGIRKAVGMTPVQILGAVASGAAWLGLLGAVLGIIAGVMLNGYMVGALADGNGYGQVSVDLTGWMIALLVAGGVGLSALAALPAAAWAGRLATARVLAAE